MRRTNYGTLVNDNEINDNEIALNYIVDIARTMGMKVSDDTAISVKFCANLIKKVKESKLLPCEDAISRQAVLNIVRGCNNALKEPRVFDCHNAGVKFEQYITDLPPVNPQPKTIQEKQAESEKYQKAFDDGYKNGYAQARFDYEQEPKMESEDKR